MEELSKQESLETAALKSGMDRKTARKYRDERKLPSDLKNHHTWKTREDPFEQDWAKIKLKLEDVPELEAKALFEDLMNRKTGKYQEGPLRTLQRKIKQWRAQHGPPKEVFFSQNPIPGEAMQTDFTWATSLEVTIGRQGFDHMLCRCVLPYSNWQWVKVCHSESMAALILGVQSAVFRLGRVPEFNPTDQSSLETHNLLSSWSTIRVKNNSYSVPSRLIGEQGGTTFLATFMGNLNCRTGGKIFDVKQSV
jgi:hypothetical protein